MNAPTKSALIACPSCRLVCDDVIGSPDAAQCPRCRSDLTARGGRSRASVWAFLATAIVFYVPANVLPVMYARLLGNRTETTIFGGLLAFWQSGAYGIALIIFVASIVVPCAKFVALTFLMLTTRGDAKWSRRARVRLHHLLESIGYWSMLDVLVVGWAIALGNFGSFGEAEPRVGIVFFGLVVVFTMLSSMSFDPRWIWSGAQR